MSYTVKVDLLRNRVGLWGGGGERRAGYHLTRELARKPGYCAWALDRLYPQQGDTLISEAQHFCA